VVIESITQPTLGLISISLAGVNFVNGGYISVRHIVINSPLLKFRLEQKIFTIALYQVGSLSNTTYKKIKI
jgi:hypothetical protein